MSKVQNIIKEEKTMSNLSKIISLFKEIIVENKFKIKWENETNIFRCDETYIILHTINTINNISNYLQIKSCQKEEFINQYYERMTEICELWCK